MISHGTRWGKLVCALGESQRSKRAVRGFSLIEILIAVIILGLGLLGLAALFPVVIREQRIGTDNVLGVTVGNSAKTILTKTDWSSLGVAGVWGVALTAREANALGDGGSTDIPFAGTSQRYELGEWVVPEVLNAARGGAGGQMPVGATVIGDPSRAAGRAGILLEARLYPMGGEPQMVWDFALQRVSDFDFSTGPYSDKLRAAIFIRRIDQRVQIPAERTLRDTLLGNVGATTDRRFPLGEDADGLPTLDGTGGVSGTLRYAGLKKMTFNTEFNVDPIATSRRPATALTGIDTTTSRGRLLAQPGQKFVDNLGNIYTVTRVEAEDVANRVRCEISPPIPAASFEFATNGVQANGLTPVMTATRRFREILFSPQIPAGVVLTEIEP